MLPRRRLNRVALVDAIAAQATNPRADVDSLAASLGSPVGFGGQTGNVRGVLAGARTLNLNSADLTQLTEQIGQGLRQQALDTLTQRELPLQPARELISDIAALPAAITLPQTTRRIASPHEETTHVSA